MGFCPKELNWLLLALFVTWSSNWHVNGDCSSMNNCNSHGMCNNVTSRCDCYEGWGASTDITYHRSADCSTQTCPAFRAWADLPSSATSAHERKECSARGTCDYTTGVCQCWPGFEGIGCQRMKCPNDCSGHGTCLRMKELARRTDALPLGPSTFYEGDEDLTWDEDRIFGCLCDSSWTVGLGSGERQEPEWFGPDCSQRHCASNDDPLTSVDETNCFNITAKDSKYRGETGNLCQVDCSNRGKCNYKTGICDCFYGFFGGDCSTQDANAVYMEWSVK